MNKSQSAIENPKPKICLTIAGLDPSGGAGIIADVKTFTAFGCFATAAVASLTFQNTCAVFGAVHQNAESVRGQVQPLVEDFEIAALKTGMLPTREIIEETARIIKENNLKNLVVDPVIRSTSGFDLIDDAALRSLIEKLFPLAEIVTPNLPEAERITRMKIKSESDIETAARIIQSLGAKNVLIKGGHNPISDSGFSILDSEEKAKLETGNSKSINPRRTKDNGRKAKDYLFTGDDLHVFEAAFIETNRTHGTGCTLAAAIAANLALGNDLIKSVETAKRFVTEAIRTAPNIGKGNSPINHRF
ncbi:MAG: hydroxymethylpyrimidine/phosphomethylpyrimidine kinase [Acidobacteriota bacterium]|nr:hydroxymethylpyrimidine/phosphomethylpyrimidine kinase [Acidobacteriota bacterium]